MYYAKCTIKILKLNKKLFFLSLCVVISSVVGRQPFKPDVKISTNLDDVNFILWTPESGLDAPFTFDGTSPYTELLKHGFISERGTKILAHGWNSDGHDFSDVFAEGKQSYTVTNRKPNI